MASVEQLYKDFGVLAEAKDKASEHEAEFLSILSGSKGGSNEKRLASQFIARFFKHFPSLSEKALEVMFDLCEDDDVMIRKQAIKDLPTVCKGAPEHLARIADVMAQLLQTEEHGELSLVHQSLISLFKIDAKGCLGGLFSQILQGEEIVRDKAIHFLQNKLKAVRSDGWDSSTEEMFITESKKVLKDVTGEEFMAFITMLKEMESMQTLKGRQDLVEIVVEQADLDQPFDASDGDAIERLITCIRMAMPFFSKNVHSTKFVVHTIDNVIPVLDQLQTNEDEPEEGKSADVQLDVLKLVAEMSMYLGDVEEPEKRLIKLYKRLLEYMPLPPAEENAENSDEKETPKLQFSYVECLMFIFHKLASKHPEFLTSDDTRLKDFKLRLQYFARGVQIYIKQLKMALQGKTGDDLKTEENKIKVAALKITNNINTLIKDLFHSPPSYKSAVTLSWKPLVSKTAVVAGAAQKRSNINPITFDGDKKKMSKSERPVYAPPSGKFSDKAGTYEPQSGGFRGNNRGRGGYRGRGGGFRGGRGRGGFRGGRGYNRY